MPAHPVDRKKHTGNGYGQTGYCSVCDTPIVGEVNARLRAGQTLASIQRWAESKGVVHHKTTWIRHKAHMTAGRDRVVQMARTVREADKITRVTNTEFLESIRDLGYRNAQDDPASVSLTHALKAVQIMETTKERPRDFLILIAQAMTGQAPALIGPPMEEGEYKEIE